MRPVAAQSICSNCDHVCGCTYLGRATSAVYYCEEHIPQDAFTTQTEEQQYAVQTRVNVEPVKGICLNCLKLTSCQISKPEGGLWHCEAYE